MKLDKYAVGKRYGKASFELAAEKNQAEAIYQELLTLREVYHRVPGISDILSDGHLEPYEKNNITEKLVIGSSEMVQNFLRMIYEYHRICDLFLVIDEYERRYGEHQELILDSVATAIPLSKEQHQAMEEEIAQLLRYEQTHLVNLIDPLIAGGVVIEASHQVIGGSIYKQLGHMQQKLLE